MTKKELIRVISDDTGIMQKDVSLVIDAFIANVSADLEKGGKIQLVGFGTFETRERSARTGKNLRTGEVIEIPARRIPAFKAGKTLKAKVK